MGDKRNRQDRLCCCPQQQQYVLPQHTALLLPTSTLPSSSMAAWRVCLAEGGKGALPAFILPFSLSPIPPLYLT